MSQANVCNCFACAREFDTNDLQSLALSKINATRFKICQACLDISDPSEDYRQVREIISSYLWFSEAKGLLKEASDILDDIKAQ
jgi:hypothetical protein